MVRYWRVVVWYDAVWCGVLGACGRITTQRQAWFGDVVQCCDPHYEELTCRILWHRTNNTQRAVLWCCKELRLQLCPILTHLHICVSSLHLLCQRVVPWCSVW